MNINNLNFNNPSLATPSDARIEITTSNFRNAIKYDNKKILKIFLEKGYKPTSEDLDFAVETGTKNRINLICKTGVRTKSSKTLDLVLEFWNLSMIWNICPEARPTGKSLDILLKRGLNFSQTIQTLGIIKPMREAMPSLQSIDLLLTKYKLIMNEIKDDHKRESLIINCKFLLKILLKKGARPTQIAIEKAITDKIDSRIILALINACGVLDTNSLLDAALSARSDEEVIERLLDSINRSPRSYDLNQAIFYDYSDEIIQLFLKKGATPDQLTLQLLGSEHSSDESSTDQLSIRTISIIENHFYRSRQTRSFKWDYPQVISPATIKGEIIEIDQVIKTHQPREDIYGPEDLPFFDEVVDPLEDPLFKYCGHKRPRDYPKIDSRPFKKMKISED